MHSQRQRREGVGLYVMVLYTRDKQRVRERVRHCDQIGRIFAYWANFNLLGQFFKLQKYPKLLALLFFHGKNYVKILTKTGLGYTHIGQVFSSN
jgi:hypothetical protein